MKKINIAYYVLMFSSFDGFSQENIFRATIPIKNLEIPSESVTGSGGNLVLSTPENPINSDLFILGSSIVELSLTPDEIEQVLKSTDGIGDVLLRRNVGGQLDFEITQPSKVTMTVGRVEAFGSNYFYLEALDGGPVLNHFGQHVMGDRRYFYMGNETVRVFDLGDLAPGRYSFYGKEEASLFTVRRLNISTPSSFSQPQPEIFVTDRYLESEPDSYKFSGLMLTDGEVNIQQPNYTNNYSLHDAQDYIEFTLTRPGEVEFYHRLAGSNYRVNDYFYVIPQDPQTFADYTGVSSRQILSTGAITDVPSQYAGEYVYVQANASFTGLLFDNNHRSDYISTMIDIPAGTYRLMLANPNGTNSLTTIVNMRFVN